MQTVETGEIPQAQFLDKVVTTGPHGPDSARGS